LELPVAERQDLAGLPFATRKLNKSEASKVAALILQDIYQREKEALQAEWSSKEMKLGDKSMKFDYRIFGEKPVDGRSLYISMHGGGNTSAAANDQQWKNQIGLYSPEEGVYLAPRAPTNTWNLWHEAHIDSFFDKLILSAVLFEGVNPDKVYLMGYSAGGDGVFQLAPRMSDRFAAAAMMAGHPNETSPLGLRNIGFALHMGELDKAYNRNEVAKRWAVMLDSLQREDPGGYTHYVKIHEGRPHWMNREDTIAVPWMARFRRDALPKKIVWVQDDVHHLNYYWLGVPQSCVKTGGLVVVSRQGNEFIVESNYADTLRIYLNDEMVNLNKKISVKMNGKVVYVGKPERTLLSVYQSLIQRKDPKLVFSSVMEIVNN
ncbi:MAG TPA: hypothetical protein VIK74_09900, partial [Parasegetibacter sp.]